MRMGKGGVKTTLKRGLFLFIFLFQPYSLWAGENSLLLLPQEPIFDHLIGDSREAQSSAVAQLKTMRFDGSIAATLEFLQWVPGDKTRWGWGVEGDTFIELEWQPLSPDSLQTYNYFLDFPEKVSDWYLGTYLSESSGDFSNRVEYLHDNSHLGDGFFNTLQGAVYTRESFRYTASFRPSDQFRLYAGAGYYFHSVPDEPPFFLHLGTEIYTGSFPFVGGALGRGYFTYDLKAKQEAGGVLNQNFAIGFQWRWKKDSRQSIRLGLLYYTGNNEYGQFYLQNDNHWSVGLFFDP